MKKHPRTLVKTAKQTIYKKTGEAAILIKFPFDSGILQTIRTIPGRKWHGEEKYWTCPRTIEAIEILSKACFVIDDKLQKYYVLNKDKINTKKLLPQLPTIKILGLKQNLYQYQKEGVQFIEKMKGRCLIGDEMGLGKTVQSLSWFHLHKTIRPIIIICPASLKYNWKNEIIQWIDYKNITVLEGRRPFQLSRAMEFIIINYDILDAWVNEILNLSPQGIILDECQLIKNNSTKRTKAVKKFKNIPFIIALSGTPIENRPIEFYNIINLLDKKLFPNYIYYAKRFCNAKYNGFGWDMNGASNTEELHRILTDNIMIRRLKKDVLAELPDKIRVTLPIKLSNEKEYKLAEKDVIGYIRQYKGNSAALKASYAEVLSEIETLKQVSAKGKIKAVIEWVKEIIANEKLVIFANHRFVIDALYDSFKNIAVKIDGSVSTIERQKAVDNFQYNNKIKLFIGNIKAAGVGITLTSTSKVAFVELPWTPGALMQAEDRCHRITQKNVVNVFYLIALGTIEEKIAALLDEKRKILDSVLDGIETNNSSLLTELINNL